MLDQDRGIFQAAAYFPSLTDGPLRHFAEVFKIDGFGTGGPFTNTFVELDVPQAIQGQFGGDRIRNASTEVPWPEDLFRDDD